MTVLVIDYGMGNLASARRSLEECGASVEVSSDCRRIDAATHLVLPGVGAFAVAMQRLREAGWADALRKAALEQTVPILGICLGMQLLADEGDEGARTQGLGLIAGRVRRLEPTNEQERVPHVGWNEVRPTDQSMIFARIPSGSDFYFVHSYHFEPVRAENILATTPYCGNIVSAVGEGRVFGTQFHPEKSSRAGFQLLRNFLQC